MPTSGAVSTAEQFELEDDDDSEYDDDGDGYGGEDYGGGDYDGGDYGDYGGGGGTSTGVPCSACNAEFSAGLTFCSRLGHPALVEACTAVQIGLWLGCLTTCG
jgi:hypothetical protein